MRLFFVSTLSFLIPLSGLFAHITGIYDVHGGNLADHTHYTGTLVVEKEGDIYTTAWELTDGSSTGTGVRQGDSLAIVFIGVDATGAPLTGVQLYKIHDDSLKEGPWTIVGEGTKGFEIAKKREHCH